MTEAEVRVAVETSDQLVTAEPQAERMDCPRSGMAMGRTTRAWIESLGMPRQPRYALRIAQAHPIDRNKHYPSIDLARTKSAGCSTVLIG
jgi:hypothetical protein